MVVAEVASEEGHTKFPSSVVPRTQMNVTSLHAEPFVSSVADMVICLLSTAGTARTTEARDRASDAFIFAVESWI